MAGRHFPIEDLADLQRPLNVLLFGRSVMEPQPNRLKLVDHLLTLGPVRISISFERMEPWNFEIDSRAQLAAALAGDWRGEYQLASDCYVEVNGGVVAGYSSLRDSFGIWAVERSLLCPGDIERWDRSFVFLHGRLGVGFGDDGRRYLRMLLAKWVDQRGSKLIAKLGLH